MRTANQHLGRAQGSGFGAEGLNLGYGGFEDYVEIM